MIRVRFHIIRNARIENVGKSQSCMVSKLRMIWKQTVGGDEVTRGAEKGGLASVHAFQHLGAQLSEYVRLIQQLRVEAVTSLVLQQPPQNQPQVFVLQ